MLTSIDLLTRRATRALTIVGFAALLMLALATVVDVVGRGLFARPMHGVGDLSAVIMAVIVSSALPACFAEKRNIAVSLLGDAVGPRATVWLETIAHLFSLLFISIFCWQLFLYAAEISTSGQSTWVLRLPLAPWWWAAACIAAIAVPVQMIVSLRAMLNVFGRAETETKGAA